MERAVLRWDFPVPASDPRVFLGSTWCSLSFSMSRENGQSLNPNSHAHRQSREQSRFVSIATCPNLVVRQRFHKRWSVSVSPGVDRRGNRNRFGVTAAIRTAADLCEDDLPPSSREEAVLQAGASLRSLLDKPLRESGPATVRQKKARRQSRLRVDIPLLDDSHPALVSLALDLITAFREAKIIEGKIAVYFPKSLLPHRPPAADEQIGSFLSLESREGFPPNAVVAIVVAPSLEEASGLEFVARSAGARPIVVMNPTWTEEEEQSESWGSLLTSFLTAYSFVPLKVQGFFSTTEGAVLKHVKSGAPEGRPWVIYVKEGGKFKSVSSLKKRPTPADLENALYSSMAMNSPVNKSIMFVRGLIGK